MALDTIITAVKTILDTVAGIGATHAYERFVADEQKFRQLFVSAGKVHGWTITRESTPDIEEFTGATRDIHRIMLRGFYGVDDAANSEKTFQDLVESIRSTFNTNRQLSTGAPATAKAHWSDRIRVRTVQHRRFAGVLCHYAELELRVTDLLIPR